MKAMTQHVSDEQVPDLAEGRGSGAERGHVASCRACAARVDEARGFLDLARRADVPEPSPLYWEAMRRSVGRRIAEEPRRSWPAWLPALAATAVVVIAVALTVTRPPTPSPVPEAQLPAWSALPPAEDDPSLPVIEGLAMADGGLAAMDEGRGVGAFLAGLSDEDSRALAESLRSAGQGGEW
jgi:hypothetical protein